MLLAWLVVAALLPLPLVLESADGRIVSSDDPTHVVAGTREPVTAIAVRLGDEVAKGEPLVTFDQQSLRLELASKEQTLEKQQRQLNNLREEQRFLREEHDGRLAVLARTIERVEAGILEVQAGIEYAEVEVRIYTDLRSDRQIDELKLQEAHAQLKQNRQRLRALEIEAEEIEAKRQAATQEWRATAARYQRMESDLEGRIAELEPQLERLRKEIGELAITAPHDGVVEGMASISIGQILPEDAWLMTLSPMGEFQFEAKFLATEAAARIKRDAPARIAFSALPWTEYGTLAARVSRVGNEELSGLITVQLDIDQEADLAALTGHGLKGQAIIEVDRVTLLQRMLRLLLSPST